MRRSKLSTIAIADLQQEIQRRQKALPKLIAERDLLDREIAQLQGLAMPAAQAAQKVAKPRAASKKTRGPQAKNKIGLADALAQVMKGKAKVTITDAMEGVLAAGYKSNAKSFRNVVNNMLHKDKRFKSVGRGEFTLKA